MYDKLVLDVGDAMTALDAMLVEAPKLSSRPMAMAIVDEYGDLLGFMRMDGTPPNSATFAVRKAYTSARMRSDLGDFRARLAGRGGAVADLGDAGLVVAAGGGAVILHPADGSVLGAIGVSGGTADEDQAVARAGLLAMKL